MHISTDIIPQRQQFIGTPKTLDYEAICVFAATGFFLDNDSYYKEQKVLGPAKHYEVDLPSGNIQSEAKYFHWHYSPKERSFERVVSEFGSLFETIIKEQSGDQRVILPLSGGLDSRTQAVALYKLGISTTSYSYAFEGGHDETWYGKRIAGICNFPFQSLQVPNGYLWDTIETLAEINQCYSEFTHPRQMAFVDYYSDMGDLFSLGHWGDVLFDDMGVTDRLSLDGQVEVVIKKIVKKSGWTLAEKLWKHWDLKGGFRDYFRNRIYHLLKDINIPHNANAQIRAFKSNYWAPRWTSVNLSVFESVRPIRLPYYDRRMCEFICQVPERYLSGRQIQIAYIKERMPELARIPWQAQRPFNLNTYSFNKTPWNIPYKVFDKLRRLLGSKKNIQRNWELQFLGIDNELTLCSYLFSNPDFKDFIAGDIVKETFDVFKKSDGIHESHAVSILLTLSLFSKRRMLPLS